MVCNRCGRIISDDATKCNYCFEEVQKIDIEKYKKSFMPKRNFKELAITFFLILVLITIGFILYNNIKTFSIEDNINNTNEDNDIINQINNTKDVVDDYNKKIENYK